MHNRIPIPPGLTLTDLIDAAGDDTVVFARRQVPLGAPGTARQLLDDAVHRFEEGIDSAADLHRWRAVATVIAADAPVFDELHRLAIDRAEEREAVLAETAAGRAA